MTGPRHCGIHGDDTTSGRCASCDAAEAHNHIFRTFLGLPPTKGDRPVCGALLPDSWDFPGHERPACPHCMTWATSQLSSGNDLQVTEPGV
jgi:hypothetical protein